MSEVSSSFQEERRILISEDKGMPRILTGHTKCPSVYYTFFTSLTSHTPPQFSTLHQTSIKIHRSNCFFGLHFFMSCKTSIKLICMLFFYESVFVILLLRPSQGSLRGVRKTFSSLAGPSKQILLLYAEDL